MKVTPLTGSIGAAVDGVRLADLTDDAFDEVPGNDLDAFQQRSEHAFCIMPAHGPEVNRHP